MTCEKCTRTPRHDYNQVTAYISTASESITKQLISALAALKYPVDHSKTYLVAEIPNFELLISELVEGEFFNHLEKNDIQLLPLEPGETLDFGLFDRTRSLTYWENLMHHKPLLDVMEHRRLLTLFQPIVRSENLEVYGYEALTRGLLTDGRHLSAHDLFTGAKALDLLFNLDRQCRETAIRHAAQHHIENNLFLNFVPTAIYSPEECLKSTVEAIQTYHLKAANVIFEVVETEQVDDYAHLKNILDFYKAQGYKTALDDVGSGFSTIETYHALDTDYIKVDMGIVRNIHLHPENQAVLDHLLQLKTSYGVSVLAEGIEREEEYHFLKAKGVDLLQGYYFGKPQPKLPI